MGRPRLQDGRDTLGATAREQRSWETVRLLEGSSLPVMRAGLRNVKLSCGTDLTEALAHFSLGHGVLAQPPDFSVKPPKAAR